MPHDPGRRLPQSGWKKGSSSISVGCSKKARTCTTLPASSTFQTSMPSTTAATPVDHALVAHLDHGLVAAGDDAGGHERPLPARAQRVVPRALGGGAPVLRRLADGVLEDHVVAVEREPALRSRAFQRAACCSTA